jgi:NAD(P)H-dependent FMN reductase
MNACRIAVVVASLRRDSFNRKLAQRVVCLQERMTTRCGAIVHGRR